MQSKWEKQNKYSFEVILPLLLSKNSEVYLLKNSSETFPWTCISSLKLKPEKGKMVVVTQDKSEVEIIFEYNI